MLGQAGFTLLPSAPWHAAQDADLFLPAVASPPAYALPAVNVANTLIKADTKIVFVEFTLVKPLFTLIGILCPHATLRGSGAFYTKTVAEILL